MPNINISHSSTLEAAAILIDQMDDGDAAEYTEEEVAEAFTEWLSAHVADIMESPVHYALGPNSISGFDKQLAAIAKRRK